MKVTDQYVAHLINRLTTKFDKLDIERKGYALFQTDEHIKRPVTIQQLDKLIKCIETEGYGE